jgi:chemotaxis protein methyltransferase WspC
MLLLGAGFCTGDFEVVGVDVSPAALATAAAASYADVSFRESDVEFVALRDRYCRRDGQRYVVAADVRGTVRFRQDNLAAPRFLEDEPRFHAIFCRNLFIYLDEPARRTALAHLRRLLLPGGALYLSAVEAGALSDPGLRRLEEEFPFVFTPVAAPLGTSGARVPNTKPRRPKPPVQRLGHATDLSVRTREREPINQPSHTDSVGNADALTQARQAADAGRLEEGAALCVELAAKGPPRAEVFYLLGVVRQAQGDISEAERCYQRALYLDPRHTEALLHMALLARRRGDERLAENFRRRAGRTSGGD